MTQSSRARAVLAWIIVALSVLAAALWVTHSQAQSLGAASRDGWLNQTFRAVPYTPPSTVYVGLASTACGTATFGTEVSSTGTGYTRTAVVSSTSTWTAPAAGMISNVNAITFSPSTTWGTVTHYFMADGPGSGAGVLICKSLQTPKYINSGDSLSFPSGSLSITVQ